MVAVAGGLAHSLALKSDGSVLAWGCSSFDDGQCSVPAGAASGVVAIAAGAYHSLALKSNGSVIARAAAAASTTASAPFEHPTVVEIASKYGKTPAQVVLRWHIEHRTSAIPKSVRPARIKENIDIFDFVLTPDEVAAIDGLDTGVRGGPDPETIDTTRYSF